MRKFSNKRKTKPALWTKMKGGLKPRAAASKPSRQWLRPRSASMTARMKIYNERREAFLKARPYCFACKQLVAKIKGRKDWDSLIQFERAHAFLEGARKPHAADQVHHCRGRAGKLLLDERYWRAVCGRAHHFIGDNPALARAAELLAQPGDWNRQEP